ncbi:enoyl-CoA hydratase/isomerase family protein [Paraburkholderia sp. HD33-4]|uniref:enoyl-CoA hydratase/isomerase family protein n=1 Tax=Paraburkholderia sp. HD33-4 TaxID=2883242 RepID=UPI001F15F572|nr:enoyl-CoA hydratase/isomerase family protein [Paraburkholderia sp. HD33-4]
MTSNFITFEQLEYKVVDSAAYIRLNRPDVLNSFTTKLYGEVKNAVRLANSDPGVDIIVITGTGRAFATGGDLDEVLSRMEDENPLALYAYDDNMPFDAVKYSSKTTIAAVNGICVAGGLAIASACDIQIAVRSAVFGAPEARIGLASSMMPSLLMSKISLSKLKYLLYTAKSISSTEAERIGLITEVVEDDALEARVLEMIQEIRRTSPTARSLYAEYINRLLPTAPNADLQRGFRSEECQEGLRAFKEKRKPGYER